jgi:hypothetical protein
MIAERAAERLRKAPAIDSATETLRVNHHAPGVYFGLPSAEYHAPTLARRFRPQAPSAGPSGLLVAQPHEPGATAITRQLGKAEGTGAAQAGVLRP